MQKSSSTESAGPIHGSQLLRDMLVVGLLMILGAVVRWRLADLPNFAPIASLAIFAGVWVRWRFLAALAPLGALLISDLALGLGNYEWALMFAVYGSLSFPVLLAPWLKRIAARRRQSWSAAATWLGATLGTAIGGALAFFLVTNSVVWFAWYAHDWQGLAACFANAVPFFRFTLMGDLTFCVSFLVMHEVATRLVATPTGRQAATAE